MHLGQLEVYSLEPPGVKPSWIVFFSTKPSATSAPAFTSYFLILFLSPVLSIFVDNIAPPNRVILVVKPHLLPGPNSTAKKFMTGHDMTWLVVTLEPMSTSMNLASMTSNEITDFKCYISVAWMAPKNPSNSESKMKQQPWHAIFKLC